MRKSKAKRKLQLHLEKVFLLIWEFADKLFCTLITCVHNGKITESNHSSISINARLKSRLQLKRTMICMTFQISFPSAQTGTSSFCSITAESYPMTKLSKRILTRSSNVLELMSGTTGRRFTLKQRRNEVTFPTQKNSIQESS